MEENIYHAGCKPSVGAAQEIDEQDTSDTTRLPVCYSSLTAEFLGLACPARLSLQEKVV